MALEDLRFVPCPLAGASGAMAVRNGARPPGRLPVSGPDRCRCATTAFRTLCGHSVADMAMHTRIRKGLNRERQTWGRGTEHSRTVAGTDDGQADAGAKAATVAGEDPLVGILMRASSQAQDKHQSFLVMQSSSWRAHASSRRPK